MSSAPDEIYRPLNRLLKIAVIGGVEAAVQLHVARGDDLNARDDHGRTPLMLAASRNRARICRVLIEAGADLSARDGAGYDALSIARAGKAAECAAEIEAAMMRARAKSGALQSEPDGARALPDTGNDGPAIGGEATTDAYPPPESSVLSPEPEAACGIEPHSLAGLTGPTRVTAPTVGIVANAWDANEPDFAIDDDKTLFDVSGWEGESESPPPEGDASLSAAPTAIHRAISLHEPIDDSADWSDFEAFLPEYAAPLPRFDNAEVMAELRALLLRALREGSVPSQAVDDLDGVSFASGTDAGTSPLRYVIEDLGAETDERFEYWAPHESFEVHVKPTESTHEEQAVDEALAFLADLQSSRNDPMRLYMRDAQRRTLIGAEEESILAKTMEDSSKQAIDALVEWPLGIARVLEEVEMVRAGTRPVSSMIAVQRDDADVGNPTTDEGSDMIEPAAESEPALEPNGGGGEIGDPDEAVGHSLFEKAVSLRALVDTAQAGDGARRKITTALHALSLSRPFLLRLADTAPDDNSAGARQFRAATRRLASARDRMTGANLRLVLSLAKRYLFSGIPMGDLIQEGNIGLIKAVDKFDWRRGFKFSTMATWWIRQQLSRSVADAALAIRLPVHFRDDVLLIERETRELEKSLGRLPSIEQLAARLGMKHGKVAMLLRAMSTPLSIEELEAELESIGSVGPDPFDALDAIQLGKALAVSLDALDPKQAKVIRLRFGIAVDEPCTLEEVGQLFEVTRERIRQIEAKAMKRLMNPGRLDKFRPWFDRGAEDRTSKPTPESDAVKSEGSRGRARGGSKPSESSYAEPAEFPVCEIPGSASPEDPGALDRLLERASEMGIVVEHTGNGTSRAIWFNVDEARDIQTRLLVRRLLALGFMHWPGKGYWK